MTDLTIIMPSWNKEKYIAEALDSVFAQEVSFAYEIVVSDDHSTDRTLEIVAEYERQHPGVIRVLRSDENLKLFRNVRRAYEICKTPYFCVLDPDDYWTDVRHLQKAVDFLARNRKFTIYCAGIEMLYSDGRRERCAFPDHAVDSDFSDFMALDAVLAYTQTCVYRNVVFSEGLPDVVSDPPFPSMHRSFRGDSFRNFIHLQRGKAHFSPETEACYRQTDEGVFQGLNDVGRTLLNAQLWIDFWRYDNGRYPQLLAQSRRIFDRAMTDLLSEAKGSAAVETNLELARTLLAIYVQNRGAVEQGYVELFLESGYLLQRLKGQIRRFLRRISTGTKE